MTSRITIWNQSTESFIRCLNNNFRHFAGCPKKLIIIKDQRTTVSVSDWYAPELKAKVEEECKAYIGQRPDDRTLNAFNEQNPFLAR